MSLSQVGATQVVTASNTTQVLNNPAIVGSGGQVGDILLCCWSMYHGASTAPTGWSRAIQWNSVGSPTISNWTWEVWYRVVDGTEASSFNFTAAGVYQNLPTLWAMRSSNGPFTGNPFGVYGSPNGNGSYSANSVANGITPLAAPGMVISWFADFVSNYTFTFNSSTNPNPGMNEVGYSTTGAAGLRTQEVTWAPFSTTAALPAETGTWGTAAGTAMLQAVQFTITEPAGGISVGITEAANAQDSCSAVVVGINSVVEAATATDISDASKTVYTAGLADRVKETTTTTGTGAITLGGAQSGYQSFAQGVGAFPVLVYYCIADQAGANWEVGNGLFNGTTGLTRQGVYSSSNGGALVNFGAGTKDVFLTIPSVLLAQLVTLLNLPTTLPGTPGKLWNNFGVVCVS